MGASWFLARALLANNYHLRYVIVSSDSESGYNSSIGYHCTCRWDCEEWAWLRNAWERGYGMHD